MKTFNEFLASHGRYYNGDLIQIKNGAFEGHESVVVIEGFWDASRLQTYSVHSNNLDQRSLASIVWSDLIKRIEKLNISSSNKEDLKETLLGKYKSKMNFYRPKDDNSFPTKIKHFDKPTEDDKDYEVRLDYDRYFKNAKEKNHQSDPWLSKKGTPVICMIIIFGKPIVTIFKKEDTMLVSSGVDDWKEKNESLFNKALEIGLFD